MGIAGPSCSGKTELARWLRRKTGAPILNLDHYYIDLAHEPLEVRAKTNFDEPAALDRDQILHDVRALAEGKTVRAPVYDFATHTRSPGDEVVEPAGLVILDGLFALYWSAVRDLLHLKVFVEAPDAVCLERRIARDTVERGRTAESVRWQFETTVRPMAHLHILPTSQWADIVLSGTEPIDQSGESVLRLLV